MEPNTTEPIDDRLAEALAALLAASIRVTSYGMARLVSVHRAQIQRSVDADQCRLTVQCDLPDGEVRVLADGEGWLKPQVLFATEIKQDDTRKPS